jgi:hypothetical protein
MIDHSSICENCGCHGSVVEDSSLLGCNAVSTGKAVIDISKKRSTLTTSVRGSSGRNGQTLESQSSTYFTTTESIFNLLKTAKCHFIRSYFIIIITLSVLRPVHILFQSAFSRLRALLLPLSISLIF